MYICICAHTQHLKHVYVLEGPARLPVYVSVGLTETHFVGRTLTGHAGS